MSYYNVLLSFYPLWNILKGVLIFLAPLLLSSCIATKEQLLEQRSEIEAIAALMEEIQHHQERQKEQLRGEISEADRQIDRLQKMLDNTQSIFGRNTANLGLTIEELMSRTQLMRGDLEVLNKKFLEIEEQLMAIKAEQSAAVITKSAVKEKKPEEQTPLPEIERPENPNDFYQLIVRIWKAERYGDARVLADEFLRKWPKHALTPNVRFAIGETYLDERQYQPAIVAYKRVLDFHPKSDRVPMALYKIGICFLSMGMKEEAKPFFEEVITKYKKSPYFQRAQEQLKKIK